MSEYSILVWSPTNTVGNRPALTSARTFFSPQPILRAAPGMVKVSGSVSSLGSKRVYSVMPSPRMPADSLSMRPRGGRVNLGRARVM